MQTKRELFFCSYAQPAQIPDYQNNACHTNTRIQWFYCCHHQCKKTCNSREQHNQHHTGTAQAENDKIFQRVVGHGSSSWSIQKNDGKNMKKYEGKCIHTDTTAASIAQSSNMLQHQTLHPQANLYQVFGVRPATDKISLCPPVRPKSQDTVRTEYVAL